MNTTLNELPSKELFPGLHAKAVHGEQMSWIFWDVAQGAVVPEHHHPHEQILHVVSGEFEFTLAGETKTYTSGAVVVIPSNVPHSGRALTPCQLMDVFTPVREEYR
jgi:quercetin dioxygenase-like cupin family protein